MKSAAPIGLDRIPSFIDSHKIMQLMNEGFMANKDGKKYFDSLKVYTQANDKEISNWLGLSERTYGTYKRARSVEFKPQLQEHILMILALLKHGKEVFGTFEQFKLWLDAKNIFFDKKAPIEFLTTASGLKFVDDRLTAMEYGDNV